MTRALGKMRSVVAGASALALLGACGGGDDGAGASPTASTSEPGPSVDGETTAESVADSGPSSGDSGDSGADIERSDPTVGPPDADDSGSPLAEQTADGDSVQFVTNPPTTSPTTTTTTTTTLAPTTTSSTTTTLPPSTSTITTTSSTTTSTSTSTTVPAPTTIRCSFAADAVFEAGVSVLTDAATLDIVGLVVDVSNARSVRVEGHTDARGSDAENQVLSQARADAAATALVAAGIDEALITAVGLGESEADQDDPTEAEMAADRRVDIVIDAEVPISTTC